MGNLVTTLTADTTGFNKAVNDAKKMLKVFTAEESVTAKTMRKVNDVTQDQVNAYKKVLDSLTKATNGTKNYKQSASALEKELQKLKLQWSNLSDTAKKSDFGKAMSESIQSTQQQLAKFRNETEKTKNSIASMSAARGGNLSGMQLSFSNLTGAITKFTGALTLADTAMKVVKDSFLSGESNIDSWSSKVEGAKSTYLAFCNAIRTHDWSNFNPFQAFMQGQQSYSSADELDTFTGMNSLYIQQLMTKVADLQTRKMNGEKVDNEANAILAELKAYYTSKENKTMQAIRDKLQANTPNVDVTAYPYNEMVEMLLSGQRGDAVWDRIKRGVNPEDLKKVREISENELNDTKAKRQKYVDEWQKIWNSSGVNPSEADVKAYTQALNNFDNLIQQQDSIVTFLNQNHDASKLLEYEGAVREAIKSRTELEAEITAYKMTEKRLTKLLKETTTKQKEVKLQQSKELKAMDKLAAPQGTVEYMEKQQKQLQEMMNREGDMETVWELKQKYDDLQRQIDFLKGKREYKFQEYKPKQTQIVEYDAEKHYNAINTEITSVGNLASAWGNVATAISSSDPSSILSAMANGISTTTQSILTFAKAAEQASQMQRAASMANYAASESEALAGGTASAAKLPYPYNLAAIASTVAAILGTFASFASVSKYAEGGIVGGSSYSGDKVVARLNSGEMVLNNRQQSNLFAMLNNGSSRNISAAEVQFRIDGKDLVGTINNYTSRQNRVK